MKNFFNIYLNPFKWTTSSIQQGLMWASAAYVMISTMFEESDAVPIRYTDTHSYIQQCTRFAEMCNNFSNKSSYDHIVLSRWWKITGTSECITIFNKYLCPGMGIFAWPNGSLTLEPLKGVKKLSISLMGDEV